MAESTGRIHAPRVPRYLRPSIIPPVTGQFRQDHGGRASSLPKRRGDEDSRPLQFIMPGEILALKRVGETFFDLARTQ